MGRRGVPPTPKAILQARGSWRGAVAADDVNMPIGAPECPAHLGDIARLKWFELVPQLLAMKILTTIDSGALSRLCETWGRRAKHLEYFKDHAETYVNEKGDEKMHPFWRQIAIEDAVIKGLEAQFGLTPSARSGLKITSVKEKTDDAKSRFFTAAG